MKYEKYLHAEEVKYTLQKYGTAFEMSVDMENFASASFHIFIQVDFCRKAVELLRFILFLVDVTSVTVQRSGVHCNEDISIRLCVAG